MQLEIDFLSPDLPVAFWRGSTIIIRPRSSEYEKGAARLRYSQKWNGPPETACQSYRNYIERIELRPFSVTERQTKQKRKRFRAVVIYFGGKEENTTADVLRSVCPELPEAWKIWGYTWNSSVLTASYEGAISWLSGSSQEKIHPCILKE
jgi:hypothetical protein